MIRLRMWATDQIWELPPPAIRARHDADIALNPAVHIPPIAERPDEIPMDRARVIQHAATSPTEIEKATLRLTALRGARTLTDAANRLGMAPVSLARWLERRALPPSLARKVCSAEV